MGKEGKELGKNTKNQKKNREKFFFGKEFPAIKKLENGQNWRFWYKTSHFVILSVHDLLQHLATAGEITQQE